MRRIVMAAATAAALALVGACSPMGGGECGDLDVETTDIARGTYRPAGASPATTDAGAANSDAVVIFDGGVEETIVTDAGTWRVRYRVVKSELVDSRELQPQQ